MRGHKETGYDDRVKLIESGPQLFLETTIKHYIHDIMSQSIVTHGKKLEL